MTMIACMGLVLIAEMNTSPERQSQELLLPYFIPMFALLAIFSGLGLMLLGGILSKPRQNVTSENSAPCS